MLLTGEPNDSSSENEDDNKESQGSSSTTEQRSNNPRQQQRDQPPLGSTANNDHSTEGNPEILLKVLVDGGQKLWHQIKCFSNFILEDLGGYQLFDRLAQWCVQHPQMAICLLAACLATFLPFLFLVGFGLSTVLMTLTGFLVLEGTILTILSMMLFGILGALAIVLFFFSIVAVATYFGFTRIYNLYEYGESHKPAHTNFRIKEQIPDSGHVMTNRTNCVENS